MLFQEYYAAAIRHGWFDPCFYFDLLQSRGMSISDPDLSLFEHYATIGWKQGLSPSPRFSVLRYLTEYPQVADAEVDPLYHWLVRGRREQCKAFALLEWPDTVQIAGQGESRRFARSVVASSRLPILFLCEDSAHGGRDVLRRLIASLEQAESVECFVVGEEQAEEDGGFGLHELDGSGWNREQKADYLAYLLAARGDLVVVSGSLATADLLAPFATRGHRIASLVHEIPTPEELAGPALSGIAQYTHRMIVDCELTRDRISAAGIMALGDIKVLPPPAERDEDWAGYVEIVGHCLCGLGNDGRRIRRTGRTLGRQEIADDLCVVVPSYNHEQFIVAAIDSVLAQSVRPREIRIIDDGSSDGSAELLQRLANEKLGIFVRLRENTGAPATINEGVAETSCPIVAVMNSDDIWHPLRIEELIDELRSGDADVVFSALRYIGPKDRCAPKRSSYQRAVADYRGGSPLWLVLLSFNFFYTTSNLIARRESFLEVGGFGPLRYCHDLEYMLKATFAGHKVKFVERSLCDYRVHGRNTIDEDWAKVRFEEAWIIAKCVRHWSGQIGAMDMSGLALRVCEKDLGGSVLGILEAMADGDGAPEDRDVHTDPRLAEVLERTRNRHSDVIEAEDFVREIEQLLTARDAGAMPALEER